MSANIYWSPVLGEPKRLDTWRPSSTITNIENLSGDHFPLVLSETDIEWLESLAEEMRTDGGGHSEAKQLIEAIKQHGRVLVEVEG